MKNVERLYRAYDADGVSALYTDDAMTLFGSRVLRPARSTRTRRSGSIPSMNIDHADFSGRDRRHHR